MTTIDPDATVLISRYWGRHRAPEPDVVQIDLSWLPLALLDTIMTLVAAAAATMIIDAFI